MFILYDAPFALTLFDNFASGINAKQLSKVMIFLLFLHSSIFPTQNNSIIFVLNRLIQVLIKDQHTSLSRNNYYFMGGNKSRESAYRDQIPAQLAGLHLLKAKNFRLKCYSLSAEYQRISTQPMRQNRIQWQRAAQDYPSFRIFLQEIEKQLRNHEQIYDRFITSSQLLKMISYFDKLYIDHNSAKEIIGLILDFMSFCKNQSGCSPPLKTTFTKNYHAQLAQRWQRVREPNYFFNKGHLRLLNFIVEEPISKQYEYGFNFYYFKCKLDLEQAVIVADIVKKMCGEDIRAFCFLSNYLHTSCFNLEKQKFSVRQIERKYIEVLELLSEKHHPAPSILASLEKLNFHPSVKFDELMPKIEIDLSKYQTVQAKEFALEEFIMSRAELSIKEFQRFNSILKEICERNAGYHFKSGVKIKSRNQKGSLLRIKQKILAIIYNEVELEKKLASIIKDDNLMHFIDIHSYTTQEYLDYQEKMKKIFSRITKPIPFKVSDLLRGKCVFTSIDQINNCCSEIKNYLRARQHTGLKLIEIDNRLNKENSDLVMKILFGSTIAELQLVMNMNTASYQFSHKIYELKRSKFFSHLTNLAHLNEQISKDYFLQVKAIVLANMKNGQNYKQKITFEEPLRNFKQFFQKLSIKINFSETHPNEIDIQMLEKEQKTFKSICSSQIKKNNSIQTYELSLNNGIYSYEMKNYSKAEKQLKLAEQQFQSTIIDKYKNLKENSCKVAFPKKKAMLQPLTQRQRVKKIQNYLLNLSLQEHQIYLKILNYTGLTFESLSKYKEALQIYEKELNLEQIFMGEQTIQTAQILNNIGNTYTKLCNYGMALKSHQECLKIIQKIHGRDSIHAAPIYISIGNLRNAQDNELEALKAFSKSLEIIKTKSNNEEQNNLHRAVNLYSIGLIEEKRSNFPAALQQYFKSLELQESIKGKGNIDTAATIKRIGSIYEKKGEYSLALEYCLRSLDIEEKVIGKGCIQSATTLNNIGTVYESQGDYFLALQYYFRSLAIQQSIHGLGKIGSASTLNNIGYTYANQKNHQMAILYYQRSLAIYKTQSNYEEEQAANVLLGLGICLYKVNQFKPAANFLKEAYRAFMSLSLQTQAQKAKQWMRQSMAKINELDFFK